MGQIKQNSDVLTSIVGLLNVINFTLNDAENTKKQELLTQRQELLNKIINSTTYDFKTGSIGIDSNGSIAMVFADTNENSFSHPASFLNIANQFNKHLSDEDKYYNNPALLAASGYDIANYLSAMQVTIMQVFFGNVIIYLPNELTPIQREEILFLINSYKSVLENDNPKPFYTVCNNEYSSELDYNEILTYINSLPDEKTESHIIK